MSQDQTEKVLNYIAALEDVNGQLLNSLKKCVEILTEFKDYVPDPDGWQEMLDLFEETIKSGERVIEDKTLH